MVSMVRPWTQRAARSYAALPRAAHPLNLPSHCKGFHRFSPCALLYLGAGPGLLVRVLQVLGNCAMRLLVK